MNMTKQSVMLSCYASAEILSARRNLHTAITVGKSTFWRRHSLGDRCWPFVLRIEFHQMRNKIA